MLRSIQPTDVQDWLIQLGTSPDPTAFGEVPPGERPRHARKTPDTRSARGLSPATVRHHALALDALFKKAKFLRLVTENPVAEQAKAVRRPNDDGDDHARRALETVDAALLLEAAFMFVRPQAALPHGPQAIAVMLLAGLRLKECRGLLVGDADWQQKQIHVQKNTHRRLKSKKARRWVPIFPQLEAASPLLDRAGGTRWTGRPALPQWQQRRDGRPDDVDRRLARLP